MGLGVAKGFAQLVTHFFAHVRLQGPADLFDPRYRLWARSHASPRAQERLERDAALLTRACAQLPLSDPLLWMGELFAELKEFRSTTSRALTELEPAEVADPELLRLLAGRPVAELIHASLALYLDDFEARILPAAAGPLRLACRELADPLAQLAPLVPGLPATPVELCWALGEHGRALRGCVRVGAPAPWNKLTPAQAVILAGHEQLVRCGRERDYLHAEWRALCSLARALDRREDELARAHGCWLARLELGPLLLSARDQGLVDSPTLTRMLEVPSCRQALFAGA